MMASRLSNPIRRVGHRGSFLLLFGAMYLLSGALTASSPIRDQPGALYVFEHRQTLVLAGMLWSVMGVVAIINAFRVEDHAGYAALAIPPISWACICAVGALTGWPLGFLAAAVYILLSLAVIVASSHPEPPPSPEMWNG